MQVNQLTEVIEKSIAYMVVDDKDTLVEMLKRSGYNVSTSQSNEEITKSALYAIKDSSRFRTELGNYLAAEGRSSYENYVEEDFFNLATSTTSLYGKIDPTKFPTTNTKRKRRRDKKEKKEGGTGVGNFLRNTFSAENIDQLVKTGINYAGTKLNAKASKEGEQNAIEYETIRNENLQKEIELKEKGGKKNAWVLPVAIVGGVLVVGTILFFALKRNNQ